MAKSRTIEFPNGFHQFETMLDIMRAEVDSAETGEPSPYRKLIDDLDERIDKLDERLETYGTAEQIAGLLVAAKEQRRLADEYAENRRAELADEEASSLRRLEEVAQNEKEHDAERKRLAEWAAELDERAKGLDGREKALGRSQAAAHKAGQDAKAAREKAEAVRAEYETKLAELRRRAEEFSSVA